MRAEIRKMNVAELESIPLFMVSGVCMYEFIQKLARIFEVGTVDHGEALFEEPQLIAHLKDMALVRKAAEHLQNLCI